jgi:hypothetical protein
MTPPSSRVIAIVADRGTVPGPSGQDEPVPPAANASGEAWAPGCWTVTSVVRRSGVVITPVHCCPQGPVRNRRISPVAGSAASIWFIPKSLIGRS